MGDRRQEVVIIGTFSHDTKANISKMLDDCLLTDEEWDDYLTYAEDESRLTARFQNQVELKLMNY